VAPSSILVRHTVFTRPVETDAVGSAAFWLIKRATKVEF
jgi:hypothetical protein